MLDKFKHITTFCFDIDGVLTDGSLLLLPEGAMARHMNIKDGYALQLAIKKRYRVLVISGGYSAEVKERLLKLGVTEIWMEISDKAKILQDYMQQENLDRKSVLCMGDDMPDLAMMKTAGLASCPADAVQEIKELSDYISHLKGGEGCARDVIEKVMKLRNDWGEDVSVRAR